MCYFKKSTRKYPLTSNVFKSKMFLCIYVNIETNRINYNHRF